MTSLGELARVKPCSFSVLAEEGWVTVIFMDLLLANVSKHYFNVMVLGW